MYYLIYGGNPEAVAKQPPLLGARGSWGIGNSAAAGNLQGGPGFPFAPAIPNDGIGIELSEAPLISNEFVSSEDGTTYHYTRWTIEGRGLIGGDVNELSVFTGTRPVTPVETFITIRNFLKQKRRRLTLLCETAKGDSAEVAYQTLLDCPGPGYAVDMEDGPSPLDIKVIEVVGRGNWVVSFKFTCAIDDMCGRGLQGNVTANFLPVLLSNRWTMSSQSDEAFFVTRKVQGIATFRKDELRRRNLVADQLRGLVIHPLAPGFARKILDCSVTSDGGSIYYKFIDHQNGYQYIDNILDVESIVEKSMGKRVDTANTDKVGRIVAAGALDGRYMEFATDAANFSAALGSNKGSVADYPPSEWPTASKSPMLSWFRETGPRFIADISVNHSMALNKMASNEQAVMGFLGAASSVANNFANLYAFSDQNKSQSFANVRMVSTGINMANNAMAVISDASVDPQYAEVVQVKIVCTPQGNLRRAFFLALSVAFGLVNESEGSATQGDNPDPYSIGCAIDYMGKAVSATLTYRSNGYGGGSLRRMGAARMFIGPNSALVGGDIPEHLKYIVRNAAFDASTSPGSPLSNTSPGTPFGIAKALAGKGLPDNRKLIAIDTNVVAANALPSNVPTYDGYSRNIVETYVPLLAAIIAEPGSVPPPPLRTAAFYTDYNQLYNRNVNEDAGQPQLAAGVAGIAKSPWANHVG